MSSLNASLSTALSGLFAEKAAIEITTNNVVNVNTPGYSRQEPILVSSDPLVVDALTFGTGVTLQGVQSIRDLLVESQIQQQTQSQGQFSSLTTALQQTQVNFTTTTSDIGTSISNFFASVNQLSTNPTSLSMRSGLLAATGSLATSFHSTANNLTQQRSSLDLNVVQNVDQINQFSQQIAQLNGQIGALQSNGENPGSLIDKRTLSIDQLSAVVDVSVITSDNSLTLTTANGAPLVTGKQSFQLQTQITASGMHDIYSQGADITSQITSGQLGGTLQARDQQIPAFQTQLDILAAGVANAVNGVQLGGFDLNGVKGTNLFNPPPAGGVGAAAGLSVAITDPSLIAASSDGTPGSNGNAEAMYALSNLPIIGGQTPANYYSNVVFNVGNATANASAQESASSLILQQLNDQRSAISGVSLDQEAANLVRYQDAYSASAQVIVAINNMMNATISMATLTG
jgi:flagellar hook-associated protein 1